MLGVLDTACGHVGGKRSDTPEYAASWGVNTELIAAPTAFFELLSLSLILMFPYS